tara:strand:+ start:9 stop:185 length:177 start_codon:yes stop_codon:yes gene_type:complete
MNEVVKLVRILRELEAVKGKIKALVVNLNDMIDNDLSNLQTEVQIELNKILDFEKDCG